VLIGVSYKGGVGDIRESPALKMIALLQALGAELAYHDSYVPEIEMFGLASVPLQQALGDADLAIIVTAHPDVDHDAIARGSVPVLDLRGVTRWTDAPGRQLL
jgi:UDP-N-acetyl-D-glucosamine dehydrogenase